MEPRYLLDTCVWLDLRIVPGLILPKTLRLIRTEATLGLASISLVEVARKAASGALTLSAPTGQWLAGATPAEVIRLYQISVPIAAESYALPGSFHKDPADRIIVATARHHDLTIITSDRRILAYPHVKSLASRK